MAANFSNSSNNLLTRPLQTSLASSLTWFNSEYAPSSIFSSLNQDDVRNLSLYDDMLVSKEFDDEELAAIDMESFCREDMHHLLNKGRRGSSCALVTSSIYRPERLFSPVPDQVHLSQDSLDMSGYPAEGDIIQTCKANKNNYTIAFEGSFICSEASFYGGDALDQRKRDLLEDLERRKAALKMSTSVDNMTTWSKLKKTPNSSNLKRFLQTPPTRKVLAWEERRTTMGSSGNVSLLNHSHWSEASHWNQPTLRRTKSLSSLTPSHSESPPEEDQVAPVRVKLNVSQVIMDNMDQESSASPSYDQNKLRSLLPNCAIPIHHSQHQQTPQARLDENSSSSTTTTTTTTSNNNAGQAGGGSDRQPSFNLVKLFIKQKSSSTDTCMDVSSGLWPNDSPSMSFEQQQQQQQQQQLNPQSAAINANIQNRNYFKRSLKLDRHEEENDVDSLDPLVNNNNAKTETVDGKVAVGVGGDKDLESNNNLINNLINNNHHTLTESSEEQSITQIYNNIRNNNNAAVNQVVHHQLIPKNTNLRRMQLQETCTRSMQTSIPKLITSATQYASKAADVAVTAGRGSGGAADKYLLSQRVKIVPSSFLKQLHTNERRGEGGIAPVYVIYPNYTLPNLDFVTKHDVILSPIDYKEPFLGMKGGAIAKQRSREQQTPQTPPSAGRPKSFTDILGGKQRNKFDYKNICDWKSLIVLLPVEYSRILRSIPDIEKELEGVQDDNDDGFGETEEDAEGEEEEFMSSSQSQRQLFCQTTPVMRRRVARPLSCDCAQYIMQTSSSSSSSNQPASSGYRGSSTILTDSEFGLTGVENELSDETGATLPPTHCGRTPKGILRRNFNRTRLKLQQGKRNSMFDGTGEGKVVDKRRSLQEFPTQQYLESLQMAEPQQGMSPLLNYKQQSSGGNDLSGLSRFRNKLSSELEALEMELCEAATRAGEEYPSAVAGQQSYDRLKLRNDVSRALCNHPKRVSFSESNSEGTDSMGTVVVVAAASEPAKGGGLQVPRPSGGDDWTTPPNSPNVSVMTQQRMRKKAAQTEQERIQSNRFKRLQIQWELLSKDSESLMEELHEIIPKKMETKSGGSTPTGPQRISRIPRPISYPAAGSRIPEPKLGGVRTPAKTATKKVSSPTTAAARNTQNKVLAQKKVANVTTNRFVPKAR